MLHPEVNMAVVDMVVITVQPKLSLYPVCTQFQTNRSLNNLKPVDPFPCLATCLRINNLKLGKL